MIRIFQLKVGGAGLAVAALVLLNTCLASADSGQARGRFAFSSGETPDTPQIVHQRLSDRDGSSLTLISPDQWLPLAHRLARSLRQAHTQFAGLFGQMPTISTSIRLIDEESFYQSTNAPRWTNALYFRGQIIIPLSASSAADTENTLRSVRHEYTHAVISAMSGGRCPGWIDEGLAQWAEGSENPALRPALAAYLRNNPAVPLALLQGGFTRLDQKMVAAAYAQSLVASVALLQTFGFPTLGKYLRNLRENQDRDQAFLDAYGITTGTFEERLSQQLARWSASLSAPKRALAKRSSTYARASS